MKEQVPTDWRNDLVEDRKTNLSYPALGQKYGVSTCVARYICKKALKAGLVTADEIYWREVQQPPPIPQTAYDDKWVKRIVQGIVVSDTGCWIWMGSINNTGMGYGQTNYRGKTISLHRKMYEVTRRVTLTAKEYVCHDCDVPACCNPAHLKLGDHKFNQRECVDKGRNYEARRTECERGHPFDEQNTIIRKGARGGLRRICRACERIRSRLSLGWTLEQAMTLPPTPPGKRPVAGVKA